MLLAVDFVPQKRRCSRVGARWQHPGISGATRLARDHLALHWTGRRALVEGPGADPRGPNHGASARALPEIASRIGASSRTSWGTGAAAAVFSFPVGGSL